jgi:hypothetical protein
LGVIAEAGSKYLEAQGRLIKTSSAPTSLHECHRSHVEVAGAGHGVNEKAKGSVEAVSTFRLRSREQAKA